MSRNTENFMPGVDIHGRLEALDQSIRSLEGRLRAVERRISGRGAGSEQDPVHEKDIYNEIEELIIHVESLTRSVDELKNREKTDHISKIEKKVDNSQELMTKLIETSRNIDQRIEVLSDMEMRLMKLEDANKITIGKIKVPVELSGLVAAFVLLVTGFLIFADRWDIIRDSTYPISIGILFGVVVIIKFVMTSRNTG